jgi:hypothetical protein
LSLDNDDIEAAVAAGVIAQPQADALRAFAAERRSGLVAESGREDESFRFMKGFNDFFFAIGILLLGSGITFFTAGDVATWPRIVAALVMWALSELLVRRMRLVLPGILLSIFFIMFVYLSVPPDLLPQAGATVPRFPLINPIYHTLFGLTGVPLATATKALIAVVAAGLYYWRFRLPFVLLPIGASLVLAVTSLVEYGIGRLPQTATSLLSLACGLAVFAAAMRYDMSDRERVTRRSDCAFWLHLLAAPMIVHSLISLLTPNLTAINNTVAAAVVLIVAVLAIVAIIIDRRALLVSALIYVGAVIAYAIGGPALWGARAVADGGLVFFTTLVILGAFVIALGVGWSPLRRFLVAHISPAMAARLPPIPNPA